MKRILKLCRAASPVALSLAAVLFLAVLAPFQVVPAQLRQRLVRPPDRDLEGTPILPAGAQTLPEGTTLILVMETRLDSGRARPSDRFLATVATPVVDANGRTLVPEGAVVEGHVTNVEPAKWRSRSGLIGINFDNILLDGRKIPIRGYLAPADARTRKQMDTEGNLKGGSSLKRHFFFVGGGAGAGATVAAVSSAGILAATGIGAAAGLTTSLLWKGKEAVVEEGQRFGLQLTSPLRVAPWYNTANRNQPLPVRGRASTRLIIPDSNIGLTPTPARPNTRLGQGPAPSDPGAVRTAAGAVAVYEVRAERGTDGYLRALITAETPTNGWRIYTHHQITGNNDTLEVRLRGFPPSSYGLRQVSHPSAPTIIVQDPNRAIARVVVHGSNGSRTLVVNPSGVATAEPYRPGTPPPTASRPVPIPNEFPSDGSAITIIPPTTPTPVPQQTPVPQTPAPAPTTLSGLAIQTANQLELFRENFAVSLGGWRNRDGSYEFLGQRKPNANERQMLDAVGYLIANVKGVAQSGDAQSRRTGVARIRDDYQVAAQTWTRIPASPELNRRWQAIQQNLQTLVNAANQ
jgi:hypothetical protein